MPLGTPAAATSYDSDSSYNPDDDTDFGEVFDEAPSDNETEATDPDESVSDCDFDGIDVDAEDQAQLFGGNLHPPEYYIQAIEEFNEGEYDVQDYSDNTLRLLNASEDDWRRFCAFIAKDADKYLESIQGPNALSIIFNFFDWSLSQKVGKDGRRKRGIKKSSSLGTYWKVFRLVFERATGNKLDALMNRKMHRVLRNLAKKHGLSDQRRVNRCMTVEDLKNQIKEAISTTRRSFKLGEIRMLFVLFVLLLAPAGARPSAILQLRLGDIRLVLARDPEGGPHKILIRFTPCFTKSYLGVKDNKTFTVPETLHDPTLLLNPHIFLLGIIFRHKAFSSKYLTSPEKLNGLDIHAGDRELPLPLRKDLKDVFIFRDVIKTVTGYEMCQSKRISASKMGQIFRKLGELLGVEYPTTAYSLRYNAANEFDQSAYVSEALRNSCLDHADSGPFRRHYLGREIAADTWAVLQHRRPQQALVKQACSISHSMSKRRPVNLSAEQAASVSAHPEVRRLKEKLRKLSPRSKPYRKLQREIKNQKQRLKRQLQQKVREEWTNEQADDDIDRQLQGLGFATTEMDMKRDCRRHLKQEKLIEALNSQPHETLAMEHQRRTDAINAVSAYCSVIEMPVTRQSAAVSEPSCAIPLLEPEEESFQHMALMSVYPKTKSERPRRCFICVGNALRLDSEDLTLNTLCRIFYNSSDLNKHFRRSHLNLMQQNETMECPACSILIEGKSILLNHAETVHGIYLRYTLHLN